MKKALFIGIAAVFLTACGSSDSASAKPSEPNETTTSVTAKEEVITEKETTNESITESSEDTEQTTEKKEFADEDFTFKEHRYDNSYYIIPTNNSDQAVSITFDGLAKDKDGNIISVDDMTINVIGPGESSIGFLYFKTDSEIASIEYTTKITPSKYYDPVIGNLDINQSISGKNVIMQLTNNGSIPAESIEGTALFFDNDGNLIDRDREYFSGLSDPIKPGETVTKQLDTRKEFDHVEVYFNGGTIK